MITFTIKGDPRGKGRPRARVVKTKTNSFVQMYTDADTRKYEEFIAECAKIVMAGRKPLVVPLEVALNVYMPIPSSWSMKKQSQAAMGDIMPTTKPDVDNVIKAILDGMNGVIYEDDKLVVDVISKKRYAVMPCVEVVIKEALPCLNIDAL